MAGVRKHTRPRALYRDSGIFQGGDRRDSEGVSDLDWSRKSGSVGQSDGAALTQKVTELPDNGRQEHS